jgi:iron(III) transport system ATP-binding protein
VDRAGQVIALVRPELVGLDADPNGRAEVMERQFRGHDVFYRVQLADGTVIVSQRPSTELVQPGARVTIRPLEGTAPVFQPPSALV